MTLATFFHSQRSRNLSFIPSDLATFFHSFIAISYTVMLLYVVLSLGYTSSSGCSSLAGATRVTLALAGTALVLLSIVAAGGMLGYAGVDTTLVVFQILPFLVREICL